MEFIGQPTIIKQLATYLPELYSSNAGMNFLVTAPSGYGKTRLCFQCCKYLTGDGTYKYYIPEQGRIKFDPTIRVHFIDEVHELEHPEVLYPILDKGKYVIFLATNEGGLLKEPLVNRCTPLIFEEYSLDNLVLITKRLYNYPVDNSFILEIIKAGNNNPRQIVSICERLNMLTKASGVPKDIEATLLEFFGIVDGLDLAAQRYLEFLKKIGGRASLETLVYGLHINKSAILYQIEPVLLYQGKIQITSKGRTLK